MTSTPSNYPRLHVNEPTEDQQLAVASSSPLASISEAFQLATGWSLTTAADPAATPRLAIHPRQAPSSESSAEALHIDEDKARKLAGAISGLWIEVEQAREEIWRREADLAAAVPVTRHRREEEHLATRLEAILRSGAAAIECQAAGLYLLDETTTELKLRACWGLTKDRLIAPARPLNGAIADLEALVGHAVALEDARQLPHWKIPEPYPAGLCVPVSSPTDPLGTLWLFSEGTREFSDQQTHLAEIIAGRLAAELQREALLRECLAAKQMDRQLMYAAQWQRDHLPTVAPLVESWQLAGWTSTDDGPVPGFYDWLVCRDGSLAAAVGGCDGLIIESALGAAALQASLRAHTQQSCDASDMLRRLNEDIWTASAGGHFASLFYAVLEPEAAQVRYAAAGAVEAFVVSPRHCHVLSEPQPLLGVEPELRVPARAVRVRKDDVLLAFASDPVAAPDELQDRVTRLVRAHPGVAAARLAELLRAALPGAGFGLVLRWREPSKRKERPGAGLESTGG